MSASEQLFDGLPVAHVVAWEERLRFQRIARQMAAIDRERARIARRFGRRAAA